MNQAKMCGNCNQMATLDVKFCPNCGHDEFQIVDLTPPWLKEAEDALRLNKRTPTPR